MVRSAMAVAAVALAVKLAGLWLQPSTDHMTHIAVDALGFHEVAVHRLDLASRLARDRSLVGVVEPVVDLSSRVGRAHREAVQTFEYKVGEGETRQFIAARLATSGAALQVRDTSRTQYVSAMSALDGPHQVAPPDPQADSRDTDLPAPPGATAWQANAILSLAPGARQAQRTSGVPASVTIAQAILESDWGRSRLATEAKNLFGIKAFGRPGTAGIYTAPTWEVYDGQNATVVARFRAYNTLEDSIEDHGNWFHENSRYRPALAVKDDPRAFAQAIHTAGYATDPAYSSKLIALMDRFNLYQYDTYSHE